MAKAYSDDLRRKTLDAYEKRDTGRLRAALPVSLGYVKKIRQQLRRTGIIERVP